MKISGAMPVHNEERFLPYSLKSLESANLNELVFVLDRCTDRTEEIIDRFSRYAKYPIVKVKIEKREWFFPTCEVMKIAYEKTSGDIIYSLGADTYYNSLIFEIDWKNLDFASFPYFAYSLFGNQRDKLHASWINFYKWILNILYPKLTKKQKFSGIMGFRREVLNATPIQDVGSEDIWFLRKSFQKGFRYKYFPNLLSYHLRPTTSSARNKQREHGIARSILKYPLWKVIAHSVLLAKPHTLKAFLEMRANRLDTMEEIRC